MVSNLLRAVGDLTLPAARSVILRSVALAIVGFVALYALVAWLLASTAVTEIVWLEWVVDVLGGLAALVVTWFLFPAVLVGIMGMFLEEVADAVERRHYPQLPAARGVGIGESLFGAARLFAAACLLNLVALPIYVFLPILNLLVFYALNGYLLGREYVELVALRRAPRQEVERLRRSRRARLFLVGVMIAFLLALPIVNLLAPVLATALMVHTLQGLRHADR